MQNTYRSLLIALILILILSGCNILYSDNKKSPIKIVTPDAQTTPVHSFIDAADDPAIWVHPLDTSKSLLLGTDKKRGIDVYNLNGTRKYSYPFGKINNIDIRYNFPLNNKEIDIVGGTNRSDWTISFYKIDISGRLQEITGTPIKPVMPHLYGFSFYHNLDTNKFYALIVGKKGEFEQYELYDNGKEQINGKLVRSLKLPSKCEGIVADDEYGKIYVSEEKHGIWKMNAEPITDDIIQIANTSNGYLVPDVEGLTIYYTTDGEGYLLASSQGDSTYAVYERTGGNRYIGSFEINRGKMDGTSHTDGIHVISYNLGPKFPDGLFIAQDGRNISDWLLRQNFKMVSWDKIANALNLKVDNAVNPRNFILR